MLPAVLGGIAAAGGSAFGGILGHGSAGKQTKFQKEFAKHGVRWRVEDAKAAGVHPLFALGAQLPSYSPVYSDSMATAMSSAGQAIGAGIASKGTPAERALQMLSIETAKKQLQESDARIGLYNSEAALARSQMKSAAPFPSVYGDKADIPGQVVPEADAAQTAVGMVEVSPARMPTRSASSSGLVAGTPPGFREFELPGGFNVILPSEQSGTMSESIESVSESILTQYGVLAENIRHYGWGWLARFLDRYLVPGSGSGLTAPLRGRRGSWNQPAPGQRELYEMIPGNEY